MSIKYLRGLLAVLALAWLASCATPDSHAPAELTFAHLNDVYEIEPVEGGRYGGPARWATVIDELRRDDTPVIVTLGGDYLGPSALGTARVDGEALEGRQMVDVLNAVGVDWATFGNHEFDVSERAFLRHLQQARFQLVSTNVTQADGQPFPGVATTLLAPVRVGARTLRIAVLGLTIDMVDAPWVRYRDRVQAAREALQTQTLRGQADAVVALTHLTLAQDEELLEALPEIDLILGGHEHENWLLRRGSQFAPIVKADANGRSMALVTMAFGPQGSRPSVSVRWKLIDDSIPSDPEVAAIARRWTEAGHAGYRAQGFEPDRLVATSTELLDGRESTVRNGPSRLTDLIASAMMQAAAPVDAALFNSGSVRIDDVLPAGPLTEYDIIRVLPFGGSVVRVRMSGELLARVLDVGVDNNRGQGGYLQLAGVRRADGHWQIGSQPLEPGAQYRVALADFLLTGRELNLGFLTRDHPDLVVEQDHGDIRKALIAELARQYPQPAGGTQSAGHD